MAVFLVYHISFKEDTCVKHLWEKFGEIGNRWDQQLVDICNIESQPLTLLYESLIQLVLLHFNSGLKLCYFKLLETSIKT